MRKMRKMNKIKTVSHTIIKAAEESIRCLSTKNKKPYQAKIKMIIINIIEIIRSGILTNKLRKDLIDFLKLFIKWLQG